MASYWAHLMAIVYVAHNPDQSLTLTPDFLLLKNVNSNSICMFSFSLKVSDSFSARTWKIRTNIADTVIEVAQAM